MFVKKMVKAHQSSALASVQAFIANCLLCLSMVFFPGTALVSLCVLSLSFCIASGIFIIGLLVYIDISIFEYTQYIDENTCIDNWVEYTFIQAQRVICFVAIVIPIIFSLAFSLFLFLFMCG